MSLDVLLSFTLKIQLKKPSDACDVYAELSDVYAHRISASMKADIQRGRATAKCS